MRLDAWTLALQAINFLVLVVLLQRFLYRPVTRAIARRKEQTEKALADAATAKAAADGEQARLVTANAKLLGARDKLLEDARAEIEAERQRAIEAARAEVAVVHENARKELVAEQAEARTELRRHAVELALELSSSILRASASPVVTEALLEQVAERLATLPADELGRLRDQAASDRGLEVVTAPALAPGAEAQLRERLVDRLGPGAHVAFASDDQLIAGVELRFPTTVISLSWRDALQRAREELVRDVAA
jgi:F0F1-type ATP synthase membrane subunit b/b'